MSLSDLIDSIYNIGFGKMCRATALGILVSCSGGQEENLEKIKVAEESIQHSQQGFTKTIAATGQVDSFSPYVDLGIVANKPFGSNLSIYIMVDDIFPLLENSTIAVAPGLVRNQVREKSNAPNRYSSNLVSGAQEPSRVELFAKPAVELCA